MAMARGRARGWRYLECRNSDADWTGSSPSLVFYGHALDLTIGEGALSNNLKAQVRRDIRKAEREGLKVQIDSTLESMRVYFALHCVTRRRHGLPPQPWSFFANLQRLVLEPGGGFITVARIGGKPVAAAIYFHLGRHALYKFGASDYEYRQLHPNHLVMWESIRQCTARGCALLHFGRTSLGNEGLRRFKLGFGAREEEIRCCKYDFRAGKFVTDVDRAEGWFNGIFGRLPLPLLRLAGQLLYRHVS
jgi:lipid II:glycine glycyltransferase (peptidoglycan interpeptide bridge formation enzyme)